MSVVVRLLREYYLPQFIMGGISRIIAPLVVQQLTSIFHPSTPPISAVSRDEKQFGENMMPTWTLTCPALSPIQELCPLSRYDVRLVSIPTNSCARILPIEAMCPLDKPYAPLNLCFAVWPIQQISPVDYLPDISQSPATTPSSLWSRIDFFQAFLLIVIFVVIVDMRWLRPKSILQGDPIETQAPQRVDTIPITEMQLVKSPPFVQLLVQVPTETPANASNDKSVKIGAAEVLDLPRTHVARRRQPSDSTNWRTNMPIILQTRNIVQSTSARPVHQRMYSADDAFPRNTAVLSSAMVSNSKYMPPFKREPLGNVKTNGKMAPCLRHKSSAPDAIDKGFAWGQKHRRENSTPSKI